MSKTVRETALDALVQIEKSGSYSNLLLNQLIKKNNLPQKDIGLLTELVYGTLQWKLTLDFYLKPYIKQPKKVDQWVRQLLLLSIYQMAFLDRIPDHAVINEAVNIAKKRGHKGISGMVNGVLRSFQRNGAPDLESINDPIEKLSVQTSHPVWLVTKWAEQFGIETAENICRVNQKRPPLTARINPLKSSREEVMDNLIKQGYQVEPGDLSEDAIKFTEGNIAKIDEFSEGYLSIQDESSMLVARALDIKNDMQVLDSCAAPGGKTTHIGELLNNTGKVYSIDLHKHKVKLIEEQVLRLSLQNVETLAADSRHLQEQFEKERFDRILVDAPCSGFGVIRRKPEIKYTKSQEDSERLAQIQLAILHSVAPLLKPGGKLVYSTCTIDQVENQEVANQFLEGFSDFEVDSSLSERMPEKLKPYVKDGQVQIFPHYFGTDGFYISCFIRKVT